MNNQLSFIPIGGIGDVTRNMYLYIYQNQILIVDCGLGFADETMLGVDLLLPDISYLLKLISEGKKIVGMVLTHGHEDHIGATPFILPQLPEFPIYATPFTAALVGEKLKGFGVVRNVNTVQFTDPSVSMGVFQCSFIRVTHSVPDTSHIVIKTPVGTLYHGSDFKFDDSPYDGHKSDYEKIAAIGKEGVLSVFSDCLGAEREGRVLSETTITPHMEQAIQECIGKCLITTYSSNIARINQIIAASEKANRKVCFVGRSLIKTKDVAKRLGYLQIGPTTEIPIDQIRNHKDNQLTLIVAGSQGQENSGMARIANGAHKEVSLRSDDTVIFSADPIPGNEVLVYELIDTIAKRGSRVLYSALTRNFHVSGHGALAELQQLIELLKPKKLIPIGGNFRHMVAYQNLAQRLGYKKQDVFLLEDGQEVIFSDNNASLGKIVPVRHVYVDEVSGEELESFVLRDRQKLSEGGIVIVLAEVDGVTGQPVAKPDIIVRGFTVDEDKRLYTKIQQDVKVALAGRKGRVTNWVYIRRLVGEVAERRIYRDLRRRPLVLPIVLEV